MSRPQVFQPLDISFADNVTEDPLNFSPIFSNRSNVLLNHYNNAEPSPPAVATDVFSSSPPEYGFFHYEVGPKTAKCYYGQLVDGVDNMPDFTDNLFPLQTANFYHNVTPTHIDSPTFHYPTPPSQNDTPPPSSQHAVSWPMPIGRKCSSSIVDDKYCEQIVDDELNGWIERAATVSSHLSSSSDQGEMSPLTVSSWHDDSPSTTAYKNQQEIFDEILRECEQKTVCCEIEIRSSESVASFEDSDDSFSVNHDRFGADDCNSTILDLTPSTSNDHVRKKDQNRQAALRYRYKRKSQRTQLHSERRRLEAEHFRLTELVRDTQREVDYLRGFLAEIQHKAGTSHSLQF